MNDRLLLALEDCLQSMQNGDSQDAVLARYPGHSAELRSLLDASQIAQGIDRDPIPQKVLSTGRLHLLAQVDEARKKRASHKAISPLMRFSLVTGFVLVFLIAGGNGLLTASASSLPGDPLYGIKRTAENAHLMFTFNPAQKLALEDEYYQLRINETEALLANQRTVQVKFSGLVESQFADGWLVSGIRVIVNPQTEVDGEITSGMHVDVEGLTQANGTVLAQSIHPESDENAGDGAIHSPASGEEHATETSQSESGETPHTEDSPTNSGRGTSGEGGGGETVSATQSDNSGSDQGSGDVTKTPQPTRKFEPMKTEAPTKTPEPSKTNEPTRTPEPTK
jgi:hypothetical protein